MRISIATLIVGLSLSVLTSASAFATDRDADGVTDALDAFPCDAAASGQIFAPAQGVFGTLAFEDHWPNPHDSDYNDAVVAYNFALATDAAGRVTQIRAVLQPLASGGRYDLGLGLALPVPTSQVARVLRSVQGGMQAPLTPSSVDSNLTVVVSANIGTELFGAPANTILNATPGAPSTSSAVEIFIELSAPVALDAALAPFDVYIFRAPSPGFPGHATSHEIHRPGYCGTANMDGSLFGTASDTSDLAGPRCFTDGRNLPSVLDVPAATPYPVEETDISVVFPQILAWATSGGTQNQSWYTAPVSAQAYPSPLSPAFPDGSDRIQPDVSCLPASPSGTGFADGQRSMSTNYILQGAAGEATSNATQMSSTSYRMQGGIVSGGNP